MIQEFNFWVYTPKGFKAGFQRDMSTPLLIAALFIIAEVWNQPKCPSMDG